MAVVTGADVKLSLNDKYQTFVKSAKLFFYFNIIHAIENKIKHTNHAFISLRS